MISKQKAKGVIYFTVGYKGWEVYNSLSDEEKNQVRILFLNELKKYVSSEYNSIINSEIERGFISRPKKSMDKQNTIFFAVPYEIYVLYRSLDKQSRRKINLAIIEKIYEFSHQDKEIEQYIYRWRHRIERYEKKQRKKNNKENN
jgi:hypothetical protein